jgi:hypothetical protein
MKAAVHGNRDRIGKDSHRCAGINRRESAGWPARSQRTNLKPSGTQKPDDGFEEIEHPKMRTASARTGSHKNQQESKQTRTKDGGMEPYWSGFSFVDTNSGQRPDRVKPWDDARTRKPDKKLSK